MSIINYKNWQLSYKDNKFNLREIYVMLNYEESDNIYVSKEELIERLDEKYEEDKEFIDFLNNYVLPSMDIFQFIKFKHYELKLGNWFKDIWYPLYNKEDIVITNEIVNFLYCFDNKSHPRNGEISENYLSKYELFLKENNINFTFIKYDNDIHMRHPFLENELKLYNKNNLKSKTWLCLNKCDFRESIIIMNNRNSKIIRKYYFTLEEISYEYTYYTLDQKYQQKLKQIENQKNLELEEAQEENTKLEWIYIASTTQYQQKKSYKIGSTTRLEKRLSGYQTGRTPDDQYYYVKVFQCYNCKYLDNLIQYVLQDFKYEKNKEMYHGIHITDLIEIVEFVVNIFNKLIENINVYMNSFRKKKLEISKAKDPTVMNELDIKAIITQLGTADREREKKLIKQVLFNFLDSLKKDRITKNYLLSNLNLDIDSSVVWKECKRILNWKRSKTPIEYNNKNIFITCK